MPKKTTSSAPEGETIPEEEQERLIREPGALDLVDEPAEEAESVEEPTERPSLAAEIFDSTLYLYSFLMPLPWDGYVCALNSCVELR